MIVRLVPHLYIVVLLVYHIDVLFLLQVPVNDRLHPTTPRSSVFRDQNLTTYEAGLCATYSTPNSTGRGICAALSLLIPVFGRVAETTPQDHRSAYSGADERGRGAPAKRLNIVVPAHFQEELRVGT